MRNKKWLAPLLGLLVLGAPAVALAQTPTSTVEEVVLPDSPSAEFVIASVESGESDGVFVYTPDQAAFLAEFPDGIPSGDFGVILHGLTPEQVAELAERDDIVIGTNTELEVMQDPELSPAGANSNSFTNLDDLHALGYDGTGATVAVLDSGIDTSISGFSSKSVKEACVNTAGYCGAQWITGGGSTQVTGAGSAAPYSSTYSGYAHGTAVSSIAVNDDGGTNAGAAPAAGLVHVRVLRPNTAGNALVTNLGSISAAVDYVDDNYSTIDSPRVVKAINISIADTGVNTTNCDTATADLIAFKAEVDQALANGITTVVSAGNTGSSTGVASPACVSSVLSVGSLTTSTGRPTSGGTGSAWGVNGVIDTSTVGDSVQFQTIGGGSTSGGGTSYAAPQVAGYAAVEYEATGFDGTDLQRVVKTSGSQTFDDRAAIGTPNGYGYEGQRLDALAAHVRATEFNAHSASRFNHLTTTRAVSTWGNFNGVGVQSGTDVVVNLAAAVGVDPADVDSFMTQVTLWGDGCLSVLGARPNGSANNAAAGTVSPTGTISTRQLVTPNSSGEVAFRLSGTCTGSSTLQFAVDVSGYFGGSSDLNEMNPERPVNGVVLGSGTEAVYSIAGSGSIPSNATGIIGMLTVTQAGSGTGFHDLGQGGATLGGAAPMVSDSSGMRNNLVATSLDANGDIKIRNVVAPGNATYYLDVYGYTLSGSASIVMVSPTRVHDSRPSSAAAPGTNRNATLLGVGSVPSSNVKAVMANLMCIQPNTAPAYIVGTTQGATIPSNPPVDVNCLASEFRNNTTIFGGNATVSIHPASSATSHFVLENMAYMPS